MDDDPGQPFGTRLPVRHPWVYLALMGFSVVWSLVYVTAGVTSLVEGPRAGLWLGEAFWLLILAGALTGLRRAVREVRHPGTEVARRRRIRERALAQPREVLLRKAALVLAVLVLVPLALGVVVLLLEPGRERLWGWAPVVLSILLAAVGVRRLRNPPF